MIAGGLVAFAPWSSYYGMPLGLGPTAPPPSFDPSGFDSGGFDSGHHSSKGSKGRGKDAGSSQDRGRPSMTAVKAVWKKVTSIPGAQGSIFSLGLGLAGWKKVTGSQLHTKLQDRDFEVLRAYVKHAQEFSPFERLAYPPAHAQRWLEVAHAEEGALPKPSKSKGKGHPPLPPLHGLGGWGVSEDAEDYEDMDYEE